MKLDIWIIEHWLREYNPLLTVTEGAQEIEGVRFLSGFSPSETSHIYIGRAKDILGGSKSDEVLLVHGNDVISLASVDLEEIFNKVIACFEFYNKWEKKLLECSEMDHPEQRIVDACDHLIGPIFIMDLKSNLIAYSRNYRLGEINPIWDDYIQLQKPSLKTIHMMNSSTYTKLANTRHDCLVFEEANAAPYSYGIMVSYCDRNKNLIGQCALCANHPITQRELALAKTIERALLSIANNTTGNFFNNIAQSIVFSALSAKALDTYDSEKLIALMGWTECRPFILNLIGIAGAEENAGLSFYLGRLSSHYTNAIGLIFNNKLVFLYQPDNHWVENPPTPNTSEIPLFMGSSFTFEKLSDLPIYYRQAEIALKYAAEKNKGCTPFSECAFDVLVHETDAAFRSYCRHPGLQLLERYDALNATPHCLTLRTYLQSERSYLLTAQRLFVHRNTILYRLAKIAELYIFDLDNPDEREYILFSFRLSSPG